MTNTWWLAISLWLIAAVFALGIGGFPASPSGPALPTLRWLVTIGAVVVCTIAGLVLVGVV